jgi:hypothetical protein
MQKRGMNRRHPEGAQRLKDPPDYAVETLGDSSLRSCLTPFRMTPKNSSVHEYRSEERAEWRNLAFTQKYFYSKISPLQNLSRQIFPVEMTPYITIHF